MQRDVDFLVIGGGIAGLTFALEAARHGRVLVLTKAGRAESNTRYAQGGIASVLSTEDSFDAHVADTLTAGAGLCRKDVVEMCVRQGPERVRELIAFGVAFDRAGDDYHLTLEGGHSRRRILHAKDLTGAEVERALVAAAEARGVESLERHLAIDLITSEKLGQPGPNRCIGAYVLNTDSGDVVTIRAKVTLLASGGCGKVYLYTTNPDVASGDGIAMAHRAGAAIADMEFIQFHPTCLFHPQAKNFLISEALRGEGGVLKRRDGATFMERYHPQKSLAPRDIVARAIDSELKKTGDDHIVLDMTHLPKAFLVERFPHIYQTCLAFGIDMAVQPIPVVPAAHFSCGGVATDLSGATTLPFLLAAGETACTGLHGANRLASNSLLEGLVFGHNASALAAKLVREAAPLPPAPDWNSGSAVPPDEGVVVAHNWDEVRRTMWNYVGIVRTNKRLDRAQRRLALLRDEIRDYYWGTHVTAPTLELRNLADVAMLIVTSARLRRESRGLHTTLDFPERDDARWLKDTVLVRGVVNDAAWRR